MKAHTVKLELYDQSARLVAVDFKTRRVLVTWGSGIESHTSGFEHRDGVWYRFTAAQSWGQQTRDERIVSRQDLGPCYDDLIFTPAIPIRPHADDPRVDLDAFADYLHKLGVTTCGERARLRAVGAWLLAMRTKLMHGLELDELAQEYHATPLSGSQLDGVIKPLVKAGLVRPYDFVPSYKGVLGRRIHAGDELNSARHFPLAIAGEMREAKMNRGEDYSDEDWAQLCQRLGVIKLHTSKAAHFGGATGSIFWYFTIGKKFADMPHFVL